MKVRDALFGPAHADFLSVLSTMSELSVTSNHNQQMSIFTIVYAKDNGLKVSFTYISIMHECIELMVGNPFDRRG